MPHKIKLSFAKPSFEKLSFDLVNTLQNFVPIGERSLTERSRFHYRYTMLAASYEIYAVNTVTVRLAMPNM